MPVDSRRELSLETSVQRDAELGEDTLAVLALHAEEISVAKRIRRTLVRATRTTTTRDAIIDEDLAREQVIVERVPIGRIVETLPEIRQEGDVTIVPVVEEEIVVQRRLILKEEVHFRREKVVERYSENASLREQQVTVTRTALED